MAGACGADLRNLPYIKATFDFDLEAKTITEDIAAGEPQVWTTGKILKVSGKGQKGGRISKKARISIDLENGHRGCQFLRAGRILLRHLIHFRYRFIELLDPPGLLLG